MAESGRQVFWNPLGMRDTARPLGDRPQDAHLIDRLQRQLVILDERASPPDQNHRDRIHESVGDSGDRVCDSRTRRHHRDARTPRRARPSVSHMRRCLLMTSVDHAHAVRTAGRVNRVEMAAVERENLAYAFLLERPYQHLAAIDFCHRRSPSAEPRVSAPLIVVRFEARSALSHRPTPCEFLSSSL